MRDQGSAQELFKSIDDAVYELESEKRFDLGGRSCYEEEICMIETENKSRRTCIGEINQVRSWCRMLQIERQEMLRRERSLGVRVG